MRPVATRLLPSLPLSTWPSRSPGSRRTSRPPSITNDPRVGLKAGFRDAAQAARGMELVATMPKAGGVLRSEGAGRERPTPRGGRGGGADEAAAPTPAPPAATSTETPPRRDATGDAAAHAAGGPTPAPPPPPPPAAG